MKRRLGNSGYHPRSDALRDMRKAGIRTADLRLLTGLSSQKIHDRIRQAEERARQRLQEGQP